MDGFVGFGKLDVPGQQIFDALDRVIGDDGEDVAQVKLWIDTVQFCRADQRIHRCSAFAARIGAGEEIVLSTERDTAQGTFRRIIVDFKPAIHAIAD